MGWGPRLGTPPSLVQMCVVAIRVVLKDVLRVAPRVVPQVVPRVVQLVPAGSPSDDTSTDGGSASILRPLSSDFHFHFIFLSSLSFVGGVFLAKHLQMLQISAFFFPEADCFSFALSVAVTHVTPPLTPLSPPSLLPPL